MNNHKLLRCVNCGKSLSEYNILFQKMKMKKNKDYYDKKNTNFDIIEIDNDINFDYSDIFEILHLYRLCCRKSISSLSSYS